MPAHRPAETAKALLVGPLVAHGATLRRIRLFYTEILRLRELITTVAQDLERIACEERYAAHVGPLIEQARRIRAHLNLSKLS
jgi:hypothetical protein